MSYEVSYIDGLAGAWIADPLPTVDAPIAQYNQAPTGGFTYQAPNYSQPAVGAPTAVLDRALEAETYVTPTGARAWKPTAADDALIDAVTQNPYTGLDELLEAGARGGAGKGVQQLPYVGDVIGGAVEGATVYGATGSVTHGVFAGAGSSIGGIAGTAVGASIGAVGGPVGIAVGGIAGGAIGSAFGSAAGQALAGLIDPLPRANVNGALQPGSDPPFTGGQANVPYRVFWTRSYGDPNQTFDLLGPLRLSRALEPGESPSDCGSSETFNRYTMIGPEIAVNLASGCGQTATNIRVERLDGLPDVDGDPDPLLEPHTPTTPLPRIPSVPGFRLPRPIPRIRPNPTSRPSTGVDREPVGTPFGFPNPFTGIPSFPDFGLPGTQPTSQPHSDPYPDPDPTNPNNPGTPDPSTGECDPCKGIQQIKEKLDAIFNQQFQGSISLFPCDSEAPSTLIYDGLGLAGLNAQITVLSQAVTEVWEKIKCGNEVEMSLPESWAIKTAKTTGQYVITWKPTDNSRSRWSSTIPHPRHTSRSAAYAAINNISFDRGDVMLNVQNKDNTSCIFNVSDRSEADKLVNWVLPLMESEYEETANPKVTEGLKPRIAPNTVWIANIKYFPNGQDDLVPEWIIRFDNNGNKINE